MAAAQVVALLLTALAGTLVVLIRQPARQAIMVSAYGLVLAALFFSVQAPDVALSAIAVGSVALPMMILLTLAKVRQHQ
jgi:uncharacterized MnhB-related membrane protein